MSNVAKVPRVLRACFAGFAFVTFSASLVKAEYGPRTIVGTNYQQTSTTISKFSSAITTDCNNTDRCTVLFQRVPQQKQLIVRHVACHVIVESGSLFETFLGTRKGQTFPLKRVRLAPLQVFGNIYVINTTVFHLIKPDERPFVLVRGTASHDWPGLECNISGQLQ